MTRPSLAQWLQAWYNVLRAGMRLMSCCVGVLFSHGFLVGGIGFHKSCAIMVEVYGGEIYPIAQSSSILYCIFTFSSIQLLYSAQTSVVNVRIVFHYR